MTLLSGAQKSVTNKPLIITLFGDAGSGKTSLACEFDDAFMIQTRGESVPRDVTNTPMQLDALGGKRVEATVNKTTDTAKIWDESELFDQLSALYREDHGFKTLIVDSVTGLEAMFIQNILDVQPDRQKTMNAAGNGYASEWETVVAKHSRVIKWAEALRDKKGMNVIFLCHASVKEVDLPDQERYQKYTLSLNSHDKPSKDSAGLYTRNMDVVGFVHQKMFTQDGKARTTGERLITVDMTAANVSKNRIGIKGDLKYTKGENPFAAYL